MSHKLRAVFTSAVLSWMLLPALRANSTFIPDSVFKGSSLTGWHVLGQANWQAQNGELVGTVKEGGGWLVLDRSYQDVALHTLFKCTGGCKTGVLFRAEKTAEGFKGVFLSIADEQSAFLRSRWTRKERSCRARRSGVAAVGCVSCRRLTLTRQGAAERRAHPDAVRLPAAGAPDAAPRLRQPVPGVRV